MSGLSWGQLQFWDEEGLIDVFLRDPEILDIPDNLRVVSTPEGAVDDVSEPPPLSHKDRIRLSGYLSKAKRLIDQDLNEGAKKYLDAIIEQAPDSEYAMKAEKLLQEIGE